ncbi:hypothetical protein MT996_04560 [Ornithobacterium rhinotracheale]|uniref:hypothetical protein n=1 Tax=Ornithobacterium rhinotracheale TaxID=28251 RepID=UPI00129CF761|nr:hypothetical protein [Ornithobacterium rhinotracheale]UOH78747.1 hypothetical protein MT996_04560 [Ornithobacterium rhinotracheale]
MRALLKYFALSLFGVISLLFFIAFVGLLLEKTISAIFSLLISSVFAFLFIKIYKIKITKKVKEVKVSKKKKEPIKEVKLPAKPISVKREIQVLGKKNNIDVSISTIIEKAYKKEEPVFDKKKFLHKEVSRLGVQLLESLNVIDETKNIDTLFGRIEFINKFYFKFIASKNEPQYLRYIQNAIDQYKSLYYNKIIKNYELSLVVKPSQMNLEIFFGDAIYRCYLRFVEKQKEDISRLKTQKAIEKRIDNIIKTGYSAKYMFKTFNIFDYNNNLDKIERVRKQFY